MAIERRNEQGTRWRVRVARNKTRYSQLVDGSEEYAQEVEKLMERELRRTGVWPPADLGERMEALKTVLGTSGSLLAAKPKGSSGPTLRQALKRCTEYVWTSTSEQHVMDTIRRAERVVAYFEEIGKPRLEEITTDDVDTYRARLIRQGLSASGVRGYLSTLSMLYKQARKGGLTYYRPDIERPRVTSRRDRSMTPEERRAALDFFHRKGWHDMADFLVLALHTGCRRGELLACRAGDGEMLDDPKQARLLVRGTKTLASYATVPLTDEARAIVARRSAGKKRGDLLFASLCGGHRVTRKWAALRDHLGLSEDKSFTFHLTRHTTARMLFDAGVDVNRIKEWMRHSDINTTMLYNSHNPRRLDDVRLALETALGQSAPNGQQMPQATEA